MSDSAWCPGIVYQMLPGGPAVRLYRYAMVSAFAIPVVVLAAVALILAGVDHVPVVLVAGGVVLVTGWLAGGFDFAARLREKKEAEAGYTTTFRGRREMAQVDPASGVVLRLAGEPHLTSERLRERRAALAEWAASRTM